MFSLRKAPSTSNENMQIAIVGTVGVPAGYGGFETLAENLVRFHYDQGMSSRISVYCSGVSGKGRNSQFLSASLEYVPFPANGAASIAYDIVSMSLAAMRRTQIILLLGVSGALALPFLKLVSRTKIITNIDGIEWRRAKWSPLAAKFLRWSEAIAVRFSDEVIVDNQGIADYVAQTYRRDCHMIAYGGDHAIPSNEVLAKNRSGGYALALCRIEPENNVDMILEAFEKEAELELVFIGNWHNSAFGRKLYERYHKAPNITLHPAIYSVNELFKWRNGAALYVHGHSAGGTNPSLVEMMHFAVPILAYDCSYNRYTTSELAAYFSNCLSLVEQLKAFKCGDLEGSAAGLEALARARYSWKFVAAEYYSLFGKTSDGILGLVEQQGGRSNGDC